MMFARGYRGGSSCLGNHPFGGGLHFLVMGLVLLVIVAVVIYFMRRHARTQVSSTALDLLKMKYVQGELTEEEYLKRKNTLNSK